MKLRASIAAAALLGLGGALAPGYAEDHVPAVATPDPVTTSDPAQPRFEPVADDSAGIASDDDTSADDGGQTWEQLGGGVASWYGPKFRGHRTASGEAFDPSEYTAAHRSLPFGTKVRVTSASGKSVVVRINDRGPYSRGRVIDVSQAAARDLGLIGPGSGRVTLAVLDQ